MSNCSWFTDGASQVFWNLLGGGITAICAGAYALGKGTFHKRSFRKIFGNDVGTEDFYLSYALLSLKKPVEKCFQRSGCKVPVTCRWRFFLDDSLWFADVYRWFSVRGCMSVLAFGMAFAIQRLNLF